MGSMSEVSERTPPLAELPFRLKSFGNRRWIEWEEEVLPPMGAARKVAMTEYDGSERFRRIVILIDMFREMESKVAGLRAERDKLQVELQEAKGELSREQKRASEWQRRAKDK
jgi:hypothetical protein